MNISVKKLGQKHLDLRVLLAYSVSSKNSIQTHQRPRDCLVVGSFHTHGKGGGSRCLDNRLIRVRHLAAHTSHTTNTANTTHTWQTKKHANIVSGCVILRLTSATVMRGERLETDTSPLTPYVNTASRLARSRLLRRSTISCP